MLGNAEQIFLHPHTDGWTQQWICDSLLTFTIYTQEIRLMHSLLGEPAIHWRLYQTLNSNWLSMLWIDEAEVLIMIPGGPLLASYSQYDI